MGPATEPTGPRQREISTLSGGWIVSASTHRTAGAMGFLCDGLRPCLSVIRARTPSCRPRGSPYRDRGRKGTPGRHAPSAANLPCAFRTILGGPPRRYIGYKISLPTQKRPFDISTMFFMYVMHQISNNCTKIHPLTKRYQPCPHAIFNVNVRYGDKKNHAPPTTYYSADNHKARIKF